MINSTALLHELGSTLGIDLRFSDAGVCGVFFDNDEVVFEQHETQLYIMADLGSAAGRGDACRRLLEANCLGGQTGQACLGLDAAREEFTLHRILDGGLDYREFENIVTLFVKALRYWKEWLTLPPATEHAADRNSSMESAAMMRI